MTENENGMFAASRKMEWQKDIFLLASGADRCYKIFLRAASGAAVGVAIRFHPSVQASSIFETVDFSGEFLCNCVKSISGGVPVKHPNIRGKCGVSDVQSRVAGGTTDLLRAFLREKPGAKSYQTKPQ